MINLALAETSACEVTFRLRRGPPRCSLRIVPLAARMSLWAGTRARANQAPLRARGVMFACAPRSRVARTLSSLESIYLKIAIGETAGDGS